MTTVAIRDLVVEFASGGYAVRPIDGLDLELATGELVLLLGASGCGKTTLLSMLAGILRPTSGSITVDGIEITTLKGDDLVNHRRRTCGVVFQAFNLVPSLTAWENVAAPLWAAGLRGRPARAQAETLLRAVDLGERMHHRPGDLSGGQQQRVAIARALAHNPPLLLADEPTAHLDYIQVDGVLQLLRGLAQPGRLVVVATHDDRLLPLADRVVELSKRADPAHQPPPAAIRLEAGQVLFRQGDFGELAYVVEEGTVEIVRELAGGGEEYLAALGPSRYFGELAPMFGLRRSGTARARTPAVVTAYGLRDFRAWQKAADARR